MDMIDVVKKMINTIDEEYEKELKIATENTKEISYEATSKYNKATSKCEAYFIAQNIIMNVFTEAINKDFEEKFKCENKIMNEEIDP